MPDWTASMRQTFEYYMVDPATWKDVKILDTITSSSISRDLETDTLGSATLDVVNMLGECYIRIYLVTIQNGITERHPLGTFLVQTPSSSFNGKIRTVSLDAYTPLIELKENPPPIGYYVPKNSVIMDVVNQLTRLHLRAPVVAAKDSTTLYYDYVAETEDTWFSFLSVLAANAKYSFALDELGRILFSPKQDTASLQPVWTFDDSNSSILEPELNMEHDLYGIPNVVEVVYSSDVLTYHTRIVNDDPNSPTSTVNRGREITQRILNPEIGGQPTQLQIQEYAERALRDLSSIEYSVTYTHGYCPVRLGDCVRLNYERAGLVDIKARVISQSIKCVPGCPVTEKAIFTTKLWE